MEIKPEQTTKKYNTIYVNSLLPSLFEDYIKFKVNCRKDHRLICILPDDFNINALEATTIAHLCSSCPLKKNTKKNGRIQNEPETFL
jgi:hypothetical protein